MNNIDKIVYINLEYRKDRDEEIKNEFNKMGITEYERFNAIHTNGFGALGCSISHLEVLENAKKRNYKNILIFEDDFQFLVSKEVLEDNLNKFFNEFPNFDVCMLSYSLISGIELLDSSVVNKVSEAETASGYIVNNHYFDKIINLYKWSVPLLNKTHMHWLYINDQSWKVLQKTDNWYYFKTRLGKQRASFSDNGRQFTDYGV